MDVPQADDVEKILDLPLAIADGNDTKRKIWLRYRFDIRQADYYLEATELLGLAKKVRGTDTYTLTREGKKYRSMDPTQQKLMVIRKMLCLPITTLVVADIISSPRKSTTKDDIERLIEEHAGIHGSTALRRAQTLVAWLRWIGEQTSSFSVNQDEISLRLSPI